MSSTIGKLNQDVGTNHIVDLDNNMSDKIRMIWDTCGGDKDEKHDSTTELDTHANTAVVRTQSIVFQTGRTSKVRAFYDEVENIESAPIVDDALNYDCPKTLNTYLLTVNNVLHIPSMQRNTVPPFFIRETGLEVNAVPRIHIRDEVKRESQSIMLPQVDLKIPLRISGVFSYFE